jgi:hypothetical protein
MMSSAQGGTERPALERYARVKTAAIVGGVRGENGDPGVGHRKEVTWELDLDLDHRPTILWH